MIDWRALPSLVAVELLRAADRIARDGHTVAFTGRRCLAGSELTVDGRLTVVRYLSGQPSPGATPETASQLLITALDSLISRARPIAVVSGQPELSRPSATWPPATASPRKPAATISRPWPCCPAPIPPASRFAEALRPSTSPQAERATGPGTDALGKQPFTRLPSACGEAAR